MANVKYLGKKKDFGPLKLKWMVAPVVFHDGISEEIEVEVAVALCDAEPTLFARTAESGGADIQLQKDFDEMTKDELMKFGEPFVGFRCSMRDTKESMIKTIVACSPVEAEEG